MKNYREIEERDLDAMGLKEAMRYLKGPTLRVLEYIAETGTTRGIDRRLHLSPPGYAGPIAKLLVLGYIDRVGERRYSVTDKGTEALVVWKRIKEGVDEP